VGAERVEQIDVGAEGRGEQNGDQRGEQRVINKEYSRVESRG
jgi:hypothetical protein